MHLGLFLNRDYGIDSFAGYAGSRFAMTFESRDFRGMDFPSAEQFAKDEAERMAETHVLDAIEENLPDDEDTSEWNWEALAKFANTRWGLNLRDRDLKKAGRDDVAQVIIDMAREAIGRVDLSEGAVMLDEDFGLKTSVGWVKYKFDLDLELDEVRELEPQALKDLICERAQQAYNTKESEYPRTSRSVSLFDGVRSSSAHRSRGSRRMGK